MTLTNRQREALDCVKRDKVRYWCSPGFLRRTYIMEYVCFGFASRTFEALERAGLITKAGKPNCQGGGYVPVVLTEQGKALLAGEGM